jgi:hypothetical protein
MALELIEPKSVGNILDVLGYIVHYILQPAKALIS